MQRAVLVLKAQAPGDGEDRRPHLMWGMADPDFALAATSRKAEDLGDLRRIAELVEPLAESRLPKLLEVGREGSEQFESALLNGTNTSVRFWGVSSTGSHVPSGPRSSRSARGRAHR